jgi:predicted acylesterase/phospholipase RssA
VRPPFATLVTGVSTGALLATRASLGTPEALELYRDVLQASSAFPIIFPQVEIDGHLFADGAVRANLLVIGLLGAEPPGLPPFGPGTIYVVQKGRADNKPIAVNKAPVASRAPPSGRRWGARMRDSTCGRTSRRRYTATGS